MCRRADNCFLHSSFSDLVPPQKHLQESTGPNSFQPFRHSFIYSSIHSCIHSFMHAFIQSYALSFLQSLHCLLIESFIQTLASNSIVFFTKRSSGIGSQFCSSSIPTGSNLMSKHENECTRIVTVAFLVR